MSNNNKTSYLFIFLLIYCVPICFAQDHPFDKVNINGHIINYKVENNIDIAIKIKKDTIHLNIDPQGNFSKKIAGKFNFDKAEMATLVLSKKTSNTSEKIDIIRKTFYLDNETIEFAIDPILKTYAIRGGNENKLEASFVQLDSLYYQNIHKISALSDKHLIDSLSYHHYNSILNLVQQNNASNAAYNRLFTLFRPSAITISDRTARIIDSLDKNFFSEAQLQSIKDTHLTFVNKLRDKQNKFLWPQLKYISYNGSDFDKLKKSCDYLLIDIWATWCGPCLQQHPFINQLALKIKNNKTCKIVGIAIQSQEETWKKHLDKHPTTYVNFSLDKDQYRILAEQIKIDGIPRYVLLRTADFVLVENDILFDDIENTLKKYNILM